MLEALLSLLITTFLLLGSPGPAPLALAGVGAVFGVQRGLPFLIGILLGLIAAIIGATLGMAALFATVPEARTVAQLIGALYIIYVAYRIATAPILSEQDTAMSPPGLVDGFVLNILNPKLYAAVMAIFAQFILPFSDHLLSLVATGMVFFLVALVVDIVWLALGGALRPLFEQPRSARTMRVTFALLMILAVFAALFT